MRLRYLLAGLFLLIVITYGVLAVLVLKLRGGATAGGPGFTAREAFPAALSAAQAWQEDSQLVSLNASWRGVGAEAIVEGEEVSWSFAFYSPSTRSLGVFAVNSAGGSQLVGSMDASPNTRTIQPESWQVDSPQVLTTFLNQGGREFLAEDSAATVSLRLGTGEDENGMVWLAIGISGDQESTLTVQVDAGTGEILGANPRSELYSPSALNQDWGRRI